MHTGGKFLQMPVNTKDFFIQNLEAARKERKMTLKELAKAAGVNISTITRAKKSDSNITLSTVEAFAKALGVTPQYLLRDPNKSETNLKLINEFKDRVDTYETTVKLYAEKLREREKALEDALENYSKMNKEWTKLKEFADKLLSDKLNVDMINALQLAAEWEKLVCLLFLTEKREYFDRLSQTEKPTAETLMRALNRKLI